MKNGSQRSAHKGGEGKKRPANSTPTKTSTPTKSSTPNSTPTKISKTSEGASKSSGPNLVTLATWTALLCMVGCVLLSVLWEVYHSDKNAPHHPYSNKSGTSHHGYTYPEFALDFGKNLAARRSLAEDYGYEPNNLKVDKRNGLSLEEFWDLYDAKWPVIVTDVVPQWPAFQKWTRDYLNSTYGLHRVVMKAVNGPLNSGEGLALPLFFFVDHTQDNSPQLWTYLMDELFIPNRPELLKDVHGSVYTDEDFFQLFPEEVRPWSCMLLWGTAHSRSSLHIDPYNWTGTNAVFWGSKKWKLFPPGQDHLLYVRPNASCGFPLECQKYNSFVDGFASDMEAELAQYPRFSSARYVEVTQRAGEMLFIPTGWFHQAFNAEETLAVSGQLMNRNNFRFVIEEILKAGNLPRNRLPEGFHNLMPPDQVSILMSLLPKEILRKGKEHTDNVLRQVEHGKRKK